MTIEWTNYLSEEAKLRQPSVMKLMTRISEVISLGTGLPHPDCFPIKSIEFDYVSSNSDFQKTNSLKVHPNDDKLYEAFQYTGGRGTTFFDTWCVDHVEKYHKPSYNGWDTIIAAGATQSLEAVLRLLCEPNLDSILSEELTYPAFLETCRPLRLDVVPIKMDDDGAMPEDLDEILTNWSSPKPKPKLYYTMPVGQNPVGVTMSLKRREELYKICQKHDIIIVEDDPYYHLQINLLETGGEPLPSLLKLDVDGRVIRFDSFSKILMPGTRCSFITANKVFIDKLIAHNEVCINSSSAPSQLLLHELLTTWESETSSSDGKNGFEKWLINLKKHYKLRRSILLDAFEKNLPAELCSWNSPSSGMFLWVDIKTEKFPIPAKFENENLTSIEWIKKLETLLFESSVSNGVLLAKGSWFMVDPKLSRIGFRATYAFAEEDDLLKASERFGSAIKAMYKDFYGENS